MGTKDIKGFATDIAFNWMDHNLGITWESVCEHAPIVVAGLLHYFSEQFDFGFFSLESMIPTIMNQLFSKNGKDWVEEHTNSPFRLQPFERDLFVTLAFDNND